MGLGGFASAPGVHRRRRPGFGVLVSTVWFVSRWEVSAGSRPGQPRGVRSGVESRGSGGRTWWW